MEVLTSEFPDYELLDSGNGRRLERFAKHTVVRPDPNVLWVPNRPDAPAWQRPDAFFVGKESASGWEAPEKLLSGWPLRYNGATFLVRPTPFRHMGIFPEQAANWAWMEALLKKQKGARVLNLFAYTGAASVLAAQAGASVCHVDASKGSTNWAKENARLSGLSDSAIRWIVDDVPKFLRREVRRGSHYDLIIMDPPVFGRGPKGEIWRLEEQIAELAVLTKELFSERPLGLLVNFYATPIYPQSLARVFQEVLAGIVPGLGLYSLNLKEKYSQKELCTGFSLRS